MADQFITNADDETAKAPAAGSEGVSAQALPSTNSLSPIYERLLVLYAQQGSREAFSKLIDQYDRRLLYFIRRILADTDGSLDVLQSVWLIAFRKLKTLKAPDAFRVWLYRITHDQAVSELRRKLKRPIPIDDHQAGLVTDDTSAENSAFEDAELVHSALLELSIDHRRILTLRFLEEMSIEEIAQVVGDHVGTVKSRLHYAKIALRRRIEELTDG